VYFLAGLSRMPSATALIFLYSIISTSSSGITFGSSDETKRDLARSDSCIITFLVSICKP
jgi:hypothetical protein